MKTTDTGYINQNNQKNLGYRGMSDTHYNQKFFEMECLDCGHKYMANGCDIWLRKCPRCQDRQKGFDQEENRILIEDTAFNVIQNTNNDNPRVGREFQEKVKQWFETNVMSSYELEHPILIGSPEKPHKFDIVDKSEKTVIECKSYTYTHTGNIPSAKLTTLNEAIFYFSFLPEETEKILVVSHAVHPKKKETLAEYYIRINGHLLGDVKVWEFNIDTNEMRKIKNH